MITGKEARELTDKSREGPLIELHMELLSDAIREAAEAGRNSIRPFEFLSDRGRYPSTEAQSAIRIAFEADPDFNWKHHESPDPGHPCSQAYHELSW